MEDNNFANGNGPTASAAVTLPSETDNDAFPGDTADGTDVVPLLEKKETPLSAKSSKSGTPAHKSALTHSIISSTPEQQQPASSALLSQVARFREQLSADEDASAKMVAYRDRVSSELEDLTATLFEEANKMVREEKIARHAFELRAIHAEQQAAEANMKLEALQTETEWRRSQMSSPKSKQAAAQNRSASIHGISAQSYPPQNFDQKPPAGIMQWLRSLNQTEDDISTIPLSDAGDADMIRHKELDPIVHREFVLWREKPSLNRDLALIQRIYTQEIEPNFEFTNLELATKVLRSVEDNTIVIEEGDKYKPFAKECSLSVAPRLCIYRMRISDEAIWHPISAFARNRIITVCDFFTYVRYIQAGLVHRGVHDTWWEIVRLRERMCQARLGIL
ncbi:putative Rab-3A-interacting protein [Hypsibius exemplaris]|uniref:Rab-3A-interacting protein n=1 Tax=Hypsibius exemplaris TaxID=2072580 RepID=A0A1W0WW11_HYPEX|nr:putative Rab-3A-interacting protein [Hypsibius exemplaris]